MRLRTGRRPRGMRNGVSRKGRERLTDRISACSRVGVKRVSSRPCRPAPRLLWPLSQRRRRSRDSSPPQSPVGWRRSGCCTGRRTAGERAQVHLPLGPRIPPHLPLRGAQPSGQTGATAEARQAANGCGQLHSGANPGDPEGAAEGQVVSHPFRIRAEDPLVDDVGKATKATATGLSVHTRPDLRRALDLRDADLETLQEGRAEARASLLVPTASRANILPCDATEDRPVAHSSAQSWRRTSSQETTSSGL